MEQSSEQTVPTTPTELDKALDILTGWRHFIDLCQDQNNYNDADDLLAKVLADTDEILKAHPN